MFSFLFPAKEKNSPSVFANNPADDNNVPPPLPPPVIRDGKDALAVFQGQLNTKSDELSQKLNDWMDLKVKILGSSVQLVNLNVDTKANPTFTTRVKELFSQLWSQIKDWVEPVQMNLDELINERMGKHIRELREHLDELCEQLKQSNSIPENELRRIKLEICDTSIDILNGAISLTSSISSELGYCLQMEKFEELAAKHLLQFLALLIIKIPLPELDFSLEDRYRNYVSSKTEPEEVSYLENMTEIQGKVLKAFNTLLRKDEDEKKILALALVSTPNRPAVEEQKNFGKRLTNSR